MDCTVEFLDIVKAVRKAQKVPSSSSKQQNNGDYFTDTEDDIVSFRKSPSIFLLQALRIQRDMDLFHEALWSAAEAVVGMLVLIYYIYMYS